MQACYIHIFMVIGWCLGGVFAYPCGEHLLHPLHPLRSSLLRPVFFLSRPLALHAPGPTSKLLQMQDKGSGMPHRHWTGGVTRPTSNPSGFRGGARMHKHDPASCMLFPDSHSPRRGVYDARPGAHPRRGQHAREHAAATGLQGWGGSQVPSQARTLGAAGQRQHARGVLDALRHGGHLGDVRARRQHLAHLCSAAGHARHRSRSETLTLPAIVKHSTSRLDTSHTRAARLASLGTSQDWTPFHYRQLRNAHTAARTSCPPWQRGWPRSARWSMGNLSYFCRQHGHAMHAHGPRHPDRHGQIHSQTTDGQCLLLSHPPKSV